MRTDPAGSQLTLRNRSPRLVVGIIYPTASVYVTNRAAAIANVPGVVVHGALESISSTSQTMYPEEGRATIGSLTLEVTDIGGAITTELRDQLNAGEGVGRREVRVFTGDTDDFTDGTWRRVETYIISSAVHFDRGGYQFNCSDVMRELREKIFVHAKTRLSADLTDSATTVTVLSTSAFNTIVHTAAFSDAPSSTVGYFRVKKTNEVIRYTGKTSTTFTGCTRGVFSTIAQALDVDTSADEEKYPEIEEVIYLEMPAPQLAYALITGSILGTANTLPANWHCGVDAALIDSTQFSGIGTDFFDPSNHANGFILTFNTIKGLKETDGKRFIEEQIYVPMWSFSPISADGKLGLRRLPLLIGAAAPNVLVDADNVIDHGPLEHRTDQVTNRIIVNFNHDGDSFTRQSVYLNTGSISAHGLGATRELDLIGLTVDEHALATLDRLFTSITDRYGAPPLYMQMQLSASLNHIEVGDVIQVSLPQIRDFAGAGGLLRSFEVQARTINWRTGELTVEVFGSSSRPDANTPPTIATPPLSDAWYSSEGVALNTVLTMSGNNVTANGNLAGNADLRSGVYYHLGNLVIDNGVTVTINNNVQLRVRGSVTINGTIDGVGRGLAAIADVNTIGNPPVHFSSDPPINVINFGTTTSSGGVYMPNATLGLVGGTGRSVYGVSAVPRPELFVSSGSLGGIPSDLRGTPGKAGGPVSNASNLVVSLGGAGAASGAGLAIVCRGTLSFGASGSINISGANGTSPGGTVSLGGHTVYAGAGAGGAPGGLLVILDGNTIPPPDLTDGFTANHGTTPQLGTPLPNYALFGNNYPTPDPLTGYDPGISGGDRWETAHQWLWVPQEVTPGGGEDELVAAPTNLAASGSDVGVQLTWVSPPWFEHDFIEVWRSTTNDRTGAVRVFRGKADAYFEASSLGIRILRFFWVRAVHSLYGVSAWHPVSATGGVSVEYGGVLALQQWTPNLVNITREGMTFTKTGGSNNTFDASVYSSEGYTRAAISFKASATNRNIDVGFNSGNPASAHDRNDIDYAIIPGSDGNLYRGISGATTSLGVTYANTDLLALIYDGVFMRWYKNGTMLYSVAVGTPGTLYFLDSSFYETGAEIYELKFSEITSVGTFQIDPNGATQPYFASDNEYIHTFTGIGIDTEFPVEISVDAPDTDSDIELVATFDVTVDGEMGTAASQLTMYIGRSSATASYGEPAYLDALLHPTETLHFSLTYTLPAQAGNQTVAIRSVLQGGDPDFPATYTYSGINFSATVVKR